MRLEVIPPGKASARLHSHTAVDEYYLVLSGRGLLRMESQEREVGPGSLIGKPTGPDLTSHIVASFGETLTILDMEIWPDSRLNAKDVVRYPDFGEIFWRGPGWGALTPDPALQSLEEFRSNYDRGYRRQPDGSWQPAAIPGTRPRSRR